MVMSKRCTVSILLYASACSSSSVAVPACYLPLNQLLRDEFFGTFTWCDLAVTCSSHALSHGQMHAVLNVDIPLLLHRCAITVCQERVAHCKPHREMLMYIGHLHKAICSGE